VAFFGGRRSKPLRPAEIAFGSAVIDSGLSSRRLPELPQVARKLHELSQLVLQLLSQPVLHKVSHEESHPSLHEESQSSSQTNWNGFEMITLWPCVHG